MKHWTKFLTLELPLIGQRRTVGSALDALDCLTSGWRGIRGKSHRMAVNCCIAALEGDAIVERSRLAFLEAAEESDILVY